MRIQPHHTKCLFIGVHNVIKHLFEFWILRTKLQHLIWQHRIKDHDGNSLVPISEIPESCQIVCGKKIAATLT